jgi:hypothetical protein
VLRIALAAYAKFMQPRMAVATSASDKLRAYLEVVGGVVRSAITHGMVMRQRDNPGADLGAYAQELVRLFDLGIRQ